MSSDDDIPNWMEKKTFMFQTTNQYIYILDSTVPGNHEPTGFLNTAMESYSKEKHSLWIYQLPGLVIGDQTQWKMVI